MSESLVFKPRNKVFRFWVGNSFLYVFKQKLNNVDFPCFCVVKHLWNMFSRRSKLTIGKRVRQRMLFTRDEAVGYFTSTNKDMADWYHLNECMNPGMPILLPMREMNERGKAKTHWKEAMNEKRQRYKEVLQ